MTGLIRKPRTFSLPPLLAAAALLVATALLVAACGGDTSGDDNLNNVNHDGDAGLDSAVDAGEPDAWIYQCPQSQPEGHFCLRGQVRHLVDDSPVALPGGATVQRLIPAEGGNRPTQLQAQAQVQPDGRFIFPSVEQYIRQDATDDHCGGIGNPTCWPFRYDHFDLLFIGDAPGYRVPRNRYGVALGNPEYLDHSDYIFGLYLLEDETYDTWQANWPGYPNEPPPPDESWCPLDPFSFDDMRLIVPVCYKYFSEPAPDLYPGGVSSVVPYADTEYTISTMPYCPIIFDSDRLDYPSTAYGPPPEGQRNVGLLLFDPDVDPLARVGFFCKGLVFHYDYFLGPGAYATFDATDGDADGHILVVHGLAHYL